MNLFDRVIGFVKGLFEQHPELRDREHVLSVRSDDPAAAGNSSAQAADDYVYHNWVQKAVNVWASSLAPLRVLVKQSDLTLDEHPLYDVLENPNPQHSSSDIWRQWAVNLALSGDVGMEFVRTRAGEFAEIYVREPAFFAVRKEPGGERYFRVQEYVCDYTSGAPYEVAPEDFCHFKFYNPLSPWRGLAPHTAVRMSVLIDQLVLAWSRMFFSNSARPDFALLVPQGLTLDERRELERQLQSRLGGVGGWHKPLILENGVQDVKVFSFPRKDLEWIQQRRLARDEVGAIWGVPDEIMGYGRDTYENFDTAERVLWSLTLKNVIDFRDEHLTRFFRGAGLLRRGQRLETDVSRVWALRRAAKTQMDDALDLFAMGVPFNTINDVLGLGVGHVAGGEIGYPGGSRRSTISGSSGANNDNSGDRERAFSEKLKVQS